MRSKSMTRLATALMGATLCATPVFAGNLDQLNYAEISGNSVDDLRNSSGFPDNAFPFAPVTRLVNPFLTITPPDATIEGTGNLPQNSGTLIRGFLEPPQTGDYTFWISGSVSVDLYISSGTRSQSGNQFAKLLRAKVDNGSGSPQDVWDAVPGQRTETIFMEKGQQYYFEMAQKTGGNPGGHVQIGWWLPDKTLQRPIPIRYAQRFNFDAFCNDFGCSGSFEDEEPLNAPVFERPSQAAGTVTTRFVTEGSAIDLTPWIDSRYPVDFQWFELVGGAPTAMADMITSTHFIERVAASDHNREFYLEATYNGNTTRSATLRLSVSADFTPPSIAFASAQGNQSGFNVVFTEDVDPVTATDPANYSVNGGATIESIEMLYGEDGNTVVVTTSPLTNAVVYEVTVENVADISDAANTMGQETAEISLTDGVISYQVYGSYPGANPGDPLSGVDIRNLEAATNRFPDNPDLTTTRTLMEIPVNVADNFGARLIGYIIPPETGNYNFVLAADDQAILFVSKDANPANKEAVAAEPIWNGSRNYTGEDRRSWNAMDGGDQGWFNDNGYLQNRVGYGGVGRNDAPLNWSKFAYGGGFPMVKGQRHYVEALVKEGGGGDNLAITWQLPGDWTQNNKDGVSNGQDPIPGQYLSLFASGALGPIIITQQPESTETTENRPVTFSLLHTGSPQFTYQWYEVDGGEVNIIPDANGRELTLDVPPLSADGTVYRALVRNLFSQAWTDDVTLTVNQDTNPPVVVDVNADTSFTTVRIEFDEPLNEAQATSLSNYSITRESDGANLVLSSVSLANQTAGGFNTVVLTTARQDLNTRYVITMNNLTDKASTPNAIAADTTETFTSWTISRGFVFYERWLNIPGGSLNNLSNASHFPNSPDILTYRTRFEHDPNGADLHDSYGGRLSGFVYPQENGQHTFFMFSDDNGSTWLSSDDNPVNLRHVASEPAWNGWRAWVTNDRRNPGNINEYPGGAVTGGDLANFDLSRPNGDRRYVEVLYKEGGGGDRGGLTWQTPSQARPNNGDVTRLTGLNIIAAYANPDGATFTFNDHPQDQTLFNGNSTSFSASGSGSIAIDDSPPVLWEWQRKGPSDSSFTSIPGANGSSFTTGNLTIANDEGAQYRVLAHIPGLVSTSEVATVTVVPDETAPTVVAASATDSFNEVFVYFSERMDQTSAQTAVNYSVGLAAGGGPVVVNSATLLSNGTTVRLDTDELTGGTEYLVQVSGVTDASVEANVIDPAANTASFTGWTASTGYFKREFYTGIGGGGMANLTNSAKFMNGQPDIVDFAPSIEHADNGFQYPFSGNTDNYGTRYTGWITVPADGNYAFVVSADDNSAIWLSTDDSPDNKELLAVEPNWNGFRNFALTDRRVGDNAYFPTVTAAPINNSANTVGFKSLVAGTQYYIEGLHKEGGGGDNYAVAWYLEGQNPPANGATGISGSNATTFTSPDNTINISSQPADAETIVGTGTSFSVAANGTSPLRPGPLTYQWQRMLPGEGSFSNIGGATGSSYSVPAGDATLANSGAQYQVVINGPGENATATSSTATLTVTPEPTEGPTLAISKSGDIVTVSYPQTSKDAGFDLESSTTLSPPDFQADTAGGNNGANFERTKDVTSGDAETYWRAVNTP